jgi:hypothetical protein
MITGFIGLGLAGLGTASAAWNVGAHGLNWVNALDLGSGLSGVYASARGMLKMQAGYAALKAKIASDPGGSARKRRAWFASSPQEFDIIIYREKAPGFEKHHGVLDVWAQQNITGYNRNDAPTMVLSRLRHQRTRDWFNSWRRQSTGSLTGNVNWKTLDIREVNYMTESMLEYAGVPTHYIRDYISAFNRYIYSIP